MPSDLDQRVSATLQLSDPSTSLIIPLPSLAWHGRIDRLWRRLLPNDGKNGSLRAIARKPLTLLKLLRGDYSQPWQPCARVAAAAVAKTVRIHACIGEHSPDAGIFLARWFAAQNHVPWIADFRDHVLAPFTNTNQRIYVPIVRRLLSTAVYTINVTPHWSTLDRDLFGRPSTNIANGFDEEEFAVRGEPSNERFTVAYFGGIKEQMHPEIFLEGVRLLRERVGSALAKEFRFTYYGDAWKRVGALADNCGVSHLVSTNDLIPRDEAVEAMSRSDVLLLLSGATSPVENRVLARGFYPGKTFEYFGARRPILCVPGDEGELDHLLRTTATGDVLRTPIEIADYLERALASWRIGQPLPYRPERNELSQYTRRALTGQLASILDRVARS